MNRLKAIRRIQKKVAKARRCPFCGSIPKFEMKVDKPHRGSIGHYAVRRACCRATGTGQTELFFTNNSRPANYRLWWNMACRLINDWNLRSNT